MTDLEITALCAEAMGLEYKTTLLASIGSEREVLVVDGDIYWPKRSQHDQRH